MWQRKELKYTHASDEHGWIEGTPGRALGDALVQLVDTDPLIAVGDVSGQAGPSWLSWASPIGWGQQMRPYADERWWVLGLVALTEQRPDAAREHLERCRQLSSTASASWR